MHLGVFCRQQLVALEFRSRRLFLAERNSVGGNGLLRFNVRKKRLYLQVFGGHFPLEMLQNVFLKNGISELELNPQQGAADIGRPPPPQQQQQHT